MSKVKSLIRCAQRKTIQSALERKNIRGISPFRLIPLHCFQVKTIKLIGLCYETEHVSGYFGSCKTETVQPDRIVLVP